ncbi:MAG: 5-methyltetrahydropteroyltriglutamate--homocysteine S-methyltransferase [Chloroflexota bacterium]
MITPPFRADHVGSLLRPQNLKQAYLDFKDGSLSAEAFKEIEDQEISRVINKQCDIGLKSISDGEFRRQIYFGHFIDACSGFTMMKSEIEFDETGRKIKYNSPAVTGKVKREHPVAGNEIPFVQLHLPDDTVQKVTLPSPADMHAFRYREGVSDQPEVYPDLDQFFEDITIAYQQEIADLASRGATYIQLDDTTFTLFCDPMWRKRFADRRYDPDQMIGRYVDWINACISERPANMTVALHQCRGNNQGEWLFSGGYEAVAEQIFGRLNIDTFFLEYDSERAGGFEPLRFVPQEKFVVLGLISSKSANLEKQDDLLRRIEEASNFFPQAQMGISPQCGFASTAPGNPLTEDDQWRKLEMVVNTAQMVWGD